MTAPDPRDRPWDDQVAIQAPLGVWLGIHGYLCLALRHPGVQTRPSHHLVQAFVDDLGDSLVESGMLTPDELAQARRVELEEIAEQARCEVCGCMEENACEGGCSWVPELLLQGRYVCTRCYEPPRIITVDDPRWIDPVPEITG